MTGTNALVELQGTFNQINRAYIASHIYLNTLPEIPTLLFFPSKASENGKKIM
jgi:hypothetical protein